METSTKVIIILGILCVLCMSSSSSGFFLFRNPREKKPVEESAEEAVEEVPKPVKPMMYLVPGSTTWNQAKAKCEKNGYSLCSESDICPDGVSPYNKTQAGDEWVAINESDNSWLAIGDAYPDRVCKTHHKLFKTKPGWGPNTQSHTFRKRVICCQ